jgi:hypothetical protein
LVATVSLGAVLGTAGVRANDLVLAAEGLEQLRLHALDAVVNVGGHVAAVAFLLPLGLLLVVVALDLFVLFRDLAVEELTA